MIDELVIRRRRDVLDTLFVQFSRCEQCASYFETARNLKDFEFQPDWNTQNGGKRPVLGCSKNRSLDLKRLLPTLLSHNYHNLVKAKLYVNPFEDATAARGQEREAEA